MAEVGNCDFDLKGLSLVWFPIKFYGTKFFPFVIMVYGHQTTR